MKIALLGWGSLLWDHRAEFDAHHEHWELEGPHLKLEFSRVSRTRNGALTLVLDSENGKSCQIAYSLSKRKDPDDAICDLRCREGTILRNIGFYFADGSRQQSRDDEVLQTIKVWALKKSIDAVIWSDLASNFAHNSKVQKPFSVQNALLHIQALDVEGKVRTAEYVWRAPDFIQTPLRDALRSQPWFHDMAENHVPWPQKLRSRSSSHV